MSETSWHGGEHPAELEEEIWGPIPSAEEMEAANASRNLHLREHVKQVADELLPSCILDDELEDLGITLGIDQASQQIQAGSLLGFSLSAVEGSYWYPKWQFVRQTDGTYTCNEQLLDLWKQWRCVQGIEFCEFLKRHLKAEDYEDIPAKLQSPDNVKKVKSEIDFSLWRGN